MVRRISNFWLATIVCGIILVSLVGCQKKEETHRMKIQEQPVEKESSTIMDSRIEIEKKEPTNPSHADVQIVKKVTGKASLRLSREPKLGEPVDLIFTVTSPEDVPEMNIIIRGFRAEIIHGGKINKTILKKNETKEYKVKVKFISTPVQINARAEGIAVLPNGQKRLFDAASRLRRVIIDEETKQFGTEEEYRAGKPEYQYDPMTGKMSNVGRAFADYNRKRMEDLKKRDPTLTDWDALYLLHDLEVLFGETGISGEKAIEILLKARKEAKDKEITKEEALERILKEMGIEKRGELSPPKSDRESDYGSIDESKKAKATTTFTGKWLYRKHLFNKDME